MTPLTVEQEIRAILRTKGKSEEEIKGLLAKCAASGIPLDDVRYVLIEEEYKIMRRQMGIFLASYERMAVRLKGIDEDKLKHNSRVRSRNQRKREKRKFDKGRKKR